MNDNNAQASADFAAFTAPDPAVVEAQKKVAQKAKEAATKKAAIPKDGLKVVEKMQEQEKADREAGEKSVLLQKISDYMKHIKEYFPERLEFVKVPKNVGPKNSVEELRVYVKDLENELGKKGALEVVKGLWVQGFKAFEKLNEGQRFGLDMTGIGNIALNSVTNRMIPETREVVPGPAVPTLAEFSIKYSSYFSTSVEARMAMLIFEIVSGVHRMNVEKVNVEAAAKKEASKESVDLMKEL